MTTKQLAQRLDRIEAQRRGAAQIFICWCPENEKHRPDCEAAGAGDDDTVLWITWQDGDD